SPSASCRRSAPARAPIPAGAPSAIASSASCAAISWAASKKSEDRESKSEDRERQDLPLNPQSSILDHRFSPRCQTPVWERPSAKLRFADQLVGPRHSRARTTPVRPAKQSFAEGRSQTGVWQRGVGEVRSQTGVWQRGRNPCFLTVLPSSPNGYTEDHAHFCINGPTVSNRLWFSTALTVSVREGKP